MSQCGQKAKIKRKICVFKCTQISVYVAQLKLLIKLWAEQLLAASADPTSVNESIL